MTRARAASIVVLVVLAVIAAGMLTNAGQQQPEPTTFFIAKGEAAASYRPSDRQLAEWALRAWERSAGGTLRFVESDEARARIRVYWASADGGQYGEMRRMVVNGELAAAVYIRPDTTALGPDIAQLAAPDPLVRETIVYLTCLHELGHALGAEHTDDFRDVMYSFGYGGDIPGFFTRYRTQLRTRADIASVSGLSAGDIAQLKAPR
jgi:hypothetical protein